MAKQLEIGRIGAPHGVRGEIRVIPLFEFPEKILKLKKILVSGDGWLDITSARFHKQFILMKFVGIDTIEQVERIKNKCIFALREQLGELPEGRYYIEDIIGISVFDLSGNLLGKLAEVITTGSNDVYVVKKAGEKDLLLPALKSVIKVYDLANEKIIVEPPIWEEEK